MDFFIEFFELIKNIVIRFDIVKINYFKREEKVEIKKSFSLLNFLFVIYYLTVAILF